MSEASFAPSLSWYHAVTLSERAESLQMDDQNTAGAINTTLAQKRLQDWKSQSPFDSSDYFTQRLAIDGLTETQFLHILGESMEAVHQRLIEPPDWLVDMLDAFANPLYTNVDLPLPLRQAVNDTFLALIKPLLQKTIDTLRQDIRKLSHVFTDLPFSLNTIENIITTSLSSQLIDMMNSTMILELSIARLLGQLNGNTPEERYRSFIIRLCQPETALGLLREYPVLARQLWTHLKNWRRAKLEFLQHLCQDQAEIKDIFSSSTELGVLVDTEDMVGDRHQHGRRVIIARFSSGRRIVYKPKSLALDIHFQELLTWLNRHCESLSFQTMRVIGHASHGWIEFIESSTCSTEEQVRNFYKRMGGYLALIYVLRGMDFHHENVIAAGEHPMLIDLEMLFQPQSQFPHYTPFKDLITLTRYHSVLATSLLPVRVNNQPKEFEVDISGIGGLKNQIRRNALQLEGEGTDKVRYVRKDIPLKPRNNRPTLQGQPVNPVDYVEAVTTGFAEVYACLQKHQDTLLQVDSPIMRCASDEIRIIVRNTNIYSLLLRQSFQPDKLRTSLLRQKEFDLLWHDIVEYPGSIPAVIHEQRSLQENDIPLFRTKPNSLNYWTEYGIVSDDTFDRSGLEIVRQRLEELGEKDFATQLDFTQAALATTITTENAARYTPHYVMPVTKTKVSSSAMIDVAVSIGVKLQERAICNGKYVAWIGLDTVDHRSWVLYSSAVDLYQGLPGIALFFAHLGRITGQEKYTSLAQMTVSTVCEELNGLQDGEVTTIGGFHGWGGIIYALTHLGMLWQEPSLVTQAEMLVNNVLPLIEQDENLNIVSGTAGCIASLIALYCASPSQPVLQAAIHCGDWLLQQSRRSPQGTYWEMPVNSPSPSFAYGVSGIAWALMKLHVVSGVERFYTTAQTAFCYERARFSLDGTDTGSDETRIPAQVSWREGPTGIGLAHLDLLESASDVKFLKKEIDTAFRMTITRGLSNNHSYGSGDMGNLEFLLQANRKLNYALWKKQIEKALGGVVASIKNRGPLCCTPFGLETPGLMNGLAGIGYGLLRLAYPEQVPSVLLLAPPNSKL